MQVEVEEVGDLEEVGEEVAFTETTQVEYITSLAETAVVLFAV